MQGLRNLAYLLVVIIGGGYLLIAGQSLLFPLFFAVFFSFLLMPLEKRIFKRIPSKFVSITLSFLFVFAIIGGTAFIFGNQLVHIISDMASIQDQLKSGLQEILNFVDRNIPYVQGPADQESMNRTMSKLMEAPIRFIGGSLSDVAGFLLNIVLTMIYTIFFFFFKKKFFYFFFFFFSFFLI